MAYNRPSVETTDHTAEPTTQEPTPRPTPGPADTSARATHLLPGDLDTDSDEDYNLTAEELIQREARRLEERAAARAAGQQTSVVFVTGRSGARLHSPDPALTRGRGGLHFL